MLFRTLILALTLTVASIGAAADYTIRLGLIAAVGHPVEQASEVFKQLVEERSDGRIEVQIFPGGQLGGEVELQDQVALGTIQMVNIGHPVMGGKLRKLDLFNLYYLWNDRDHMMNVMMGEIGDELWEEYRQVAGARVLAANWQQGTRQTITKQPISSPSEFRGIKIRVTAGVPLYIDLWSAMGANPVPLSFTEAYSAMQTGVVDAVELPLDWILNAGFYELGDYIDLTEHYYYVNVMLVNDRFFAGLPDDLQDVLTEASLEAGLTNTELVFENEATLRGELEDRGITFVDADVAAFQEAVQSVFEARMDVWGQDLFDRIVAAGQQ